jgi:hypothetical protein
MVVSVRWDLTTTLTAADCDIVLPAVSCNGGPAGFPKYVRCKNPIALENCAMALRLWLHLPGS